MRKDTDEEFVPDDDDTTRKQDQDSLIAARKHKADSIKEARADISDSIKDVRKHIADSVKKRRASLADSTKEARADAADSLKDLRQHKADSVAKVRARNADSLKKARAAQAKKLTEKRKHATDSLKAVRKHATDSMARVRKKNTGKGAKDSMTRARTAKMDSIKEARKEHLDSLKQARTATNQAVTAARKAKTDSVRTIQKKRTDSLARIRKYKNSRHYADSVQIVRHEKADSIRESREARRDSMMAARKHTLDSAKFARKKVADSVKVVRTRYTDSLKVVRKRRADSLQKMKDAREKMAKAKEKANQDKKKAIYELKLKNKREAWSNKSMLKKSWSPFRKFTQNSFTHYNYYYNANRKMEEAMLNMQRTRKENYDSLIGLYPFDPNRDSALLKADMDSVIRRVSVGIQIHDPRNKWANDLFLIMGQAYYYKGNFDQSARSFRYIIAYDEQQERKDAAEKAKNGGSGAAKTKEQPSVLQEENHSRLDFLKHKSVHNDAVLWLARTYSTAHQTENAGAVVSMLESDPKLPEDLQGRLAVEKASIYIADNNYQMASPYLAIASNDDNLPSILRMRAAFLNGQIMQNAGQYAEAAGSFNEVLTYYPKPEMEFYARKNIAYNQLMAGQDPQEAIDPLKSILTDGKFVGYYDQVYFIMGQLAMKANNKEEAIKYFSKSVTTPKASKKQKAISFATLGDISYNSGDYNNARHYYDSATKYAASANKDTTVNQALQRSKGLAEIAAPASVIHEQDSLLALSALGPRDQMAAVKRYLKYLQKKYEDSIANINIDNLQQVATNDPSGDPNDMTSWYFSNPANLQLGSGDFKKKFGNRPLTDNWGRASAQLQSSASDQGDNNSYLGGGETDEYGLPTEEALLAKIPNKQAQKELAYKLEQRSYILLAKAYMRQLEDYKTANHTLDTLDKRYPKHNQKEEELYLRYQIAVKQGNIAKAKEYSKELLDNYPESQYASLVKPREEGAGSKNAKGGVSVNEYYDETYDMIMQHQYDAALGRIKIAQNSYDNPVYKKRFEVAKALCYAGKGDLNTADTLISAFVKKNREDSLIGWATSIESYIKDVREHNGIPSWYNDSSYFQDAKTQDAIAKKKKKKYVPPPPAPPPIPIPAAFTYYPDDPHYCIVVLPGLDSRTATLKKGVYSFDSGKFDTVKVLLDLYNSHAAVLLIKQFVNADSAKSYMNAFKTSDAMQQYQPGEAQFYVISAKNYVKMYYDRKLADYISYYGKHY